jgi:hypothetical protein
VLSACLCFSQQHIMTALLSLLLGVSCWVEVLLGWVSRAVATVTFSAAAVCRVCVCPCSALHELCAAVSFTIW